MSKDWLQHVRKFDWTDLHCKVLRITVGESDEGGVKYTCVMGLDELTGDYYVIHASEMRTSK